MQREYNYEDVYLVPQKCLVKSRSECDITTRLGPHTFRNPIIPANMKSVVNYDTCKYLSNLNMFYIMHRFDLNQEEYFDFLKTVDYTSISVGIKQHDKDMLIEMRKQNINLDYVTIDVANAYSDHVRGFASYIADLYPKCFIIVGNVCTPDAILFLQSSPNIHAIKIGISCGSVCSTKNATGFNRRMVSTMVDCGKVANIPLIADGSIKEIGHFAIALNTSKRTNFVMSGNLFAGFEQSSGKVLVIDNKQYKEYYGNASEQTKGNKKHVEGFCQLIPYKGDMGFFIEQIEDGLKSSVSYAGVKDIKYMYDVPMICYK